MDLYGTLMHQVRICVTNVFHKALQTVLTCSNSGLPGRGRRAYFPSCLDQWWPCAACSSGSWRPTAGPSETWWPGARDKATLGCRRLGRRSRTGRAPWCQDGCCVHWGTNLPAQQGNTQDETTTVHYGRIFALITLVSVTTAFMTETVEL